MPLSFQITVSAEADPVYCTVQLVDDSAAQVDLRWIYDLRKLANDMVKGILIPGTSSIEVRETLPVEVREEGAFRYYRVPSRIKSDWILIKD